MLIKHSDLLIRRVDGDYLFAGIVLAPIQIACVAEAKLLSQPAALADSGRRDFEPIEKRKILGFEGEVRLALLAGFLLGFGNGFSITQKAGEFIRMGKQRVGSRSV
ncbi:MAG: hypothetical protein AAB495_04320 [Patescibacteria group bacterium]